jgi:hypothetical protein
MPSSLATVKTKSQQRSQSSSSSVGVLVLEQSVNDSAFLEQFEDESNKLRAMEILKGERPRMVSACAKCVLALVVRGWSLHKLGVI